MFLAQSSHCSVMASSVHTKSIVADRPLHSTGNSSANRVAHDEQTGAARGVRAGTC